MVYNRRLDTLMEGTDWMKPRSAIRKRGLGRTGLEVTEIGLGAMDTPQAP